MFDFFSNLSIYTNRLGELVLMSGKDPGPIYWDFGPLFHDTEWFFVCEL